MSNLKLTDDNGVLKPIKKETHPDGTVAFHVDNILHNPYGAAIIKPNGDVYFFISGYEVSPTKIVPPPDGFQYVS